MENKIESKLRSRAPMVES